MKHLYDDADAFDSDDLTPALTARITHLSRKWAEEEDGGRRSRHMRRAEVRRRIEDWRDDRSLSNQLDDLLED